MTAPRGSGGRRADLFSQGAEHEGLVAALVRPALAAAPARRRAAGRLAFMPARKGLRSTGDQGDHTVRLWDLGNGREVKRLGAYEFGIDGVAVSGDGKRVLFGVNGHRTARLVEIDTGKELQRFAH